MRNSNLLPLDILISSCEVNLPLGLHGAFVATVILLLGALQRMLKGVPHSVVFPASDILEGHSILFL